MKVVVIDGKQLSRKEVQTLAQLIMWGYESWNFQVGINSGKPSKAMFRNLDIRGLIQTFLLFVVKR